MEYIIWVGTFPVRGNVPNFDVTGKVCFFIAACTPKPAPICMKIYSLLTVLSFLFMAGSCKKEKTPSMFVPEYLKKMLPYRNGQVVRYANPFGRSVEATVAINSRIIKKANCPSCDASVLEETIGYVFTSGGKTFVNISIDTRPHIFMSIYSFIDNFQVGAGFDFETMEDVPQPSCNAPRQSCLSSVMLNGNWYTDVLQVISGASGDAQLTKAYYTVSKGLIGFAYGSGITYTLVE